MTSDTLREIAEINHAKRQWGSKEQVRELVPLLQKYFKTHCIVFPANCIMDMMLIARKSKVGEGFDPTAIGLVRFTNLKGVSSLTLEESEVRTFSNWWHILRDDGAELKQLIIMVDADKNSWWAYYSDLDKNTNTINLNKWRALKNAN